MRKHITHLVFSGNALRSLCLCGVLRYLYCYNLHTQIRDVAGTSMGALFCFAFALKIPIEELESILYNLSKNPKLTKFNSSSFINIINSYGLGSSHDYLDVFREYLQKKYNQNDITFLELSKKTGINLYVSTTCINNYKNKIFNVNETPDISVIDAIAASMCIPILSKPVKIGDDYYIDGCLTNNFPYEYFIENNVNKENILGVGIMDVNNENKNNNPTSFITYMSSILHLVHLNTNKLCYTDKIQSHPSFLIIKNSPIRSIFNLNINDDCIDFSLTDDDINNSILQGFKAMNDYMNN
jgi:NTE family protein